MIADTSFLIDIMRHDVKAVGKLRELLADSTTIFVTTPTLFELWAGIGRSTKPESERKKLQNAILEQSILPFDAQSAEEAGIIDADLSRRGVLLQSVDCMIAGIAKEKNEKIITRNVKHFEKTGVLIETY